jgi:hypothetical protein
MMQYQDFCKKWKEIDPRGVVVPSLCILVLPFVIAKAWEVPWLEVTHYAPLGTAVTAVVALLAYRRNLAIENDRVLSIKAKEALEHAYDTLTSTSSSLRYTWLATSRMLLRFKKLKAQLQIISYQDACLSDEGFWRHRFYCALSSAQQPLATILKSSPGMSVDKQIEPRSALVILEFVSMNADPIDEVDENDLYSRVKGKWGIMIDRWFEQKLPSLHNP